MATAVASPEPARAETVAPGALSRLLVELAAVREDERTSWREALAPGDRVGRFEVRAELGRGGFGAVYEAADLELGRAVALKVLRPGRSPAALAPDALRGEAEAVARLEHPSIVTLFDVGRSPAGPFLVMELLQGETLAQRLERGPLPDEEALAIAEEMARALSHAHGRGVLHRDLKPANVFLTGDGRVKLLDFGIAHLVGRTSSNGISGTPAYMAPEQARGDPPDARADVYAAGLILVEMLAGARVAASVAGGAALALAPAVPGRVVRLARAALDPDPARRPRDGGAWLASIRAARGALHRRRRLRRGALVVAAVAALAIAVVGTVTWRLGWSVDRATLAVQRVLEGPDAVAAAADAQAVTRSLEAYQAYSEGLRCSERTLSIPLPTGERGCREHFQRAVAIDPTFAMAQYQLAVGTFLGQDFTGIGLPALREAVRYLDRAPASERIKIRAFAAWAEGREAEAASLYREAAARHPDDFFVLHMAAFFFLLRDEPELALPLQRRAAELAPVPGMGTLELVDALGALGRTEELAALERRLQAVVAAGGHPRAAVALVIARVLLGDPAGALAVGRGALAAAGTEAARREIEEHLWMARIMTGDLGVEAELRRHCDEEATYQLFTLLGLAGRRAEAIRLRALGDRPECPPQDAESRRSREESFFLHASLVRFGAGVGEVELVRDRARLAVPRNAALAPHLAVYLAYAGDPAADELARGLEPGSPRRRGYDAVRRWRRGEREAARGLLREIEARHGWANAPPHVLPAAFLLGELSAELGDDPAAIDALERFGKQWFYRLDFWSWAYPRSLYLLARSYERVGDLDRARERIARLLALWAHADPDLPDLREARALGTRLGVR